MNSGANFSACGQYRYDLWRTWGNDGDPHLIVIGLNPSTANATEDDPTIRRCIGFAKREGMAGLVMLNLFALRATDPKVMLAHPDPVGLQNDEKIKFVCRVNPTDVIIAAWGTLGGHKGRDAEIVAMIPKLKCFGLTKGGYPRHPLYVRADAPLLQMPGSPVRIQRKRTKGFDMQAVSRGINGLACYSVARPGPFGNPFQLSNAIIRIKAIELFEELANAPDYSENVRKVLKGKNLACFCPLDQLCHADILLRIANQ